MDRVVPSVCGFVAGVSRLPSDATIRLQPPRRWEPTYRREVPTGTTAYQPPCSSQLSQPRESGSLGQGEDLDQRTVPNPVGFERRARGRRKLFPALAGALALRSGSGIS
jgi:hypothetical protein